MNRVFRPMSLIVLRRVRSVIVESVGHRLWTGHLISSPTRSASRLTPVTPNWDIGFSNLEPNATSSRYE